MAIPVLGDRLTNITKDISYSLPGPCLLSSSIILQGSLNEIDWITLGGSDSMIGVFTSINFIRCTQGNATITARVGILGSSNIVSNFAGHIGLGSNAAVDNGSMNGWNNVNAVIGIQNKYLTYPIPGGGIVTNIFNSMRIEPSVDLTGFENFSGIYNDIETIGTKDVREVYGIKTELYLATSGDTLWGYAASYANYIANTAGPISEAYGISVYVSNESTSTIGKSFGISTAGIHHFGTGVVDESYGLFVWSPLGSGPINKNFAIWTGAQAKSGTLSYHFWADEQGVFRIRADNTFNSVYQAIAALYNPQFTKYTPGAVNYERVILGQFNNNIAEYGTQAGGTGVLRAVKFIGDHVKFGTYYELTEMTAPAAGAVNTCRVYAEDNGAGKTRLMAKFNTGAAQQLAIEP